jgi:hypothetical protein
MTDWLAPLRAALDDAPRPVTFFFRDDDAGWGDERLFALLDVFGAYAAPLDLAAIPAEMSPRLVTTLRRRGEAQDGLLGIHQHGYAHVDHERGGRRSEFGAARGVIAQRADIARGQALLWRSFGALLQPIFTPPWNRCTLDTGACLVDLGVGTLSRDVGAGRLAMPGLRELPVDVDWGAGRFTRTTPELLGAALASRAREGGPVGVMLHHAAMDGAQRRAVDALLELLTGHRSASCRSMGAALQETRETAVV